MRQNVENVCKHNLFGFCKFLETCRAKHNNETCSDNSCKIEKGNLRHPHPREYRYIIRELLL